MEALFVLALIGVASSLAAWLGIRVLRLPPASLPPAGRALLEFVGLWAACLLFDVTLGVAAILLVRAATPLFVSAYLVNDLSLVILSALQAFVLHAWAARSRG